VELKNRELLALGAALQASQREAEALRRTGGGRDELDAKLEQRQLEAAAAHESAAAAVAAADALSRRLADSEAARQAEHDAAALEARRASDALGEAQRAFGEAQRARDVAEAVAASALAAAERARDDTASPDASVEMKLAETRTALRESLDARERELEEAEAALEHLRTQLVEQAVLADAATAAALASASLELRRAAEAQALASATITALRAEAAAATQRAAAAEDAAEAARAEAAPLRLQLAARDALATQTRASPLQAQLDEAREQLAGAGAAVDGLLAQVAQLTVRCAAAESSMGEAAVGDASPAAARLLHLSEAASRAAADTAPAVLAAQARLFATSQRILGGSQRCRVRFMVRYTAWSGEEVRLCGADPGLGGWDATAAVPMRHSAGVWSADVELPAGRCHDCTYTDCGRAAARSLPSRCRQVHCRPA
jgi:hypothetical protein